MSTDRSLTDAAVSPNGLPHVAQPQPVLRATRDIVFLDPDVADYHLLAAAAADGIEVVILDGPEPGPVQIASVLRDRKSVTTIHLVTHGYPGGLKFRNGTLNRQSLKAASALLCQIGQCLSDDAEILLYGCDVGAGAVGAAFIAELAALTQARVAASCNQTGSAAAGADWTLEVTTGAIISGLFADQQSLDAYPHLLVTPPPVVTGINPSDNTGATVDGTTSATAPAITGTAQPGDAIQLFVDGDPVGTASADPNGDWTVALTSPLPDGQYTLVATADSGDLDGPSNLSSAFNLIIDTQPPAAPNALAFAIGSDTGITGDSITKLPTPTISGTAEAGSSVTLYDTNGTTALGTTTADNFGDWSITPSSPLSSGFHLLTAKATDIAGNESSASTKLLVLVDQTPPAIPTIVALDAASDTGTASDNITKLTTPTVTGTAEAGSTVVLYDSDHTTVLGTGTADLSGTWSITCTVLTDGLHTITAKAMDAAGNLSSASASLSVKVDLTVAAPAGLALASPSDSATLGDGITSATTPTVTGMAEAGSTVTLYDTDGTSVLGTGTANGSGQWSITSSTLSEGSHTLSAKAVDVAGNASVASTGFAVTVDHTAPAAPAAPVFALGSDTGVANDGITKLVTPSFSGTAEAGSTVTLYDTDGTSVLGTTTANGLGQWSITSSTLSEGSHTLTAKAVDVAGNASVASTGFAVTVDTQVAAPAGLALTALSDSATLGDGITSATTPTVTGTAEAGSTVTLYDTDGTSVLGTTTANGLGQWSITSSTLSEGSHTLTAKAVDVAGNASLASTGFAVTVDHTAPAAPAAPVFALGSDTGVANDGITKLVTPTVSGTAEVGSTVTLYDTDGTTILGTTTANGLGQWSITSSTLSEGSHTLTAKAVDVAGNASLASTGLAVTVDTQVAAPAGLALAALSDSATLGDGITSATTPEVTGTAEAGSTVTLYDTDGTSVLGTTTANGLGQWSITSSTLSEGSHTLTAKAVDVAGNASVASTGFAVTVDTQVAAPAGLALTALSDSATLGDGITSATTPTVTGTAEAGSTVTLYDTDGTSVLGTATANGLGQWSITSSTLSEGSHTLTAKAVDVAGNASLASTGFAVTVDHTAPAAPAAPAFALGSDTGVANDGITKLVTPTVSGTAEVGSTVTLYDTDGTTILGTATANGLGQWSITSSTLGEGSHTLTAKAVDVAGNASVASTGLAVTVDTQVAAPAGLALAALSDSATLGDGITSATTPTVTGTAEAGSTVTLYDTDGTSVLGTTTANGLGQWSITSSTLSEGSHTLTAKAVDPAGNASLASTGFAVTVDHTAPAAPAALAFANGTDTGVPNDGISKVNTPEVSGTAEVGSTVTLYDTDGTTILGTTTANGLGQWSITSSTLSEGIHILTAKAADAAGNVSAASDYIGVWVDATPPATPTTLTVAAGSDTGLTGDFITSVTTPIVNGTADAGSIVTLYDTNGTTVLGTTTATGSGSWSITSSILSEGSHTLTAKAVDVAGNASVASTGLAVTVDTQVAAPAGLALAALSDSATLGDGITSATTPTVTGTAEAGSTVTLYDTDGTSVLGTTTANGLGQWSITSSTLSEGSHTLTAKAVDPAGNASVASTGFAVTVDHTAPAAPAAPVFALGSDTGVANDGITKLVTPTVSGTAEVGSTVTLYDTDGTTILGTTTANGLGQWSITSSTLSEGSHTLTAKAVDVAGNASVASTGFAVTVDTQVAAPAGLALAALSDSATLGDGITSATTPTVTGTAEAGSTVTLYDTDGTSVLGTTTANGLGQWSITSSTLSEGSHTLTAKAVDVAGNASVASTGFAVTVDTQVAAPAGLALTALSDSATLGDGITSATTPTVTGTAEAGSTVTLYDTDGTSVLGTATANGLGQWSITSSTLSEGSHTLTAKAVDVAGNASVASTGFAVTVDHTAPAAPAAPVFALGSDTGVANDGITKLVTPTVSGTAEVGSTVTLYDTDGTSVLGTATANGLGQWSITSSTLGEGSHTLTAKAVDPAGNVSLASTGLAVTVDTQVAAPAGLALASPSDSAALGDGITSVATPTVTGTAEAGSTVTLYDTDGTTILGTGTANGSGQWSITSSTLNETSHTLTAKAVDPAGNVSLASTGFAVTVDHTAPAAPAAPVFALGSDTGVANDGITKLVTPSFSGTAEAGSTVTLYDTDGTTILGTGTANGLGQWSITASALADGVHILTAKSADAAGNVSGASVPFGILVDLAAPSTPSTPALLVANDTGTPGDGITSVTTPTVSGTAEAYSIVTLYDTDGLTVLGTAAASNVGAWSITSLPLADGDHTLTVTAVDVAGNMSTPSSGLALKIDTHAPASPAAPALAGSSDSGLVGDGITSVTTPTVTGTAEVGSTVTLYDTDGTSVLGTGTANGSGQWSITSSTLSEGSHTLTAKAVDVAGNVSLASTGFAVTVDHTAPAAPAAPVFALGSDTGVANDGITKLVTPSFSGTAEAGSTVTLYDTDGTTILGTATANGLGQWSITSSTLSEGSHTLTAKAVDVAGNASLASTGFAVTVDHTAPAAPAAPAFALGSDTGVANDGITKLVTPSFSGTAEAGSTVTLYDTDGTSVLGTGTANGSGQWSITSSTLSEGSHTLTAKAVDVAGNVSLASTGFAVTVDHTAPAAPAAPVFALGSDTGVANDGITKLVTPSFSGTAEAGSTVTLYDTDGTTILGTATANGLGQWSITSSTLSEGSHTLTAKAVDVAGNASLASTGFAVTVDHTAPAAPAAPVFALGSDTGVANDGITKLVTPTVSGTAEVGSTVTLYDTDGTSVLGTTTANGLGQWSITSSTLGEGSHTLTAKAVDVAGNASVASTGLAVTVDHTAPAAPAAPVFALGSDTGVANDGITKLVTPSFSGTAEAGSTVTLYDTDGTTILGTATANGLGQWSITSSTLSEGSHTLTAKAVDVAGNASLASTGFAVTVDHTAPAAPAAPAFALGSDTGVANDGITKLVTPSFSGTAEAGSTVTLYDTDGTSVLGTGTANGSGQWSITSSTLSEGSHTLTAKAVDVAGNVSLASTGFAVTVDHTAPAAPAAPVFALGSDTGVANDGITKLVTPSFSGTAEAGSTVTLYDTDGTTILGTATANGLGQWSITSSTLSEGSHTLTAKAVDVAGNASLASTGFAVTVDHTAPAAPAAPVFALGSDTGVANDGITKLVTPTVSGTAEVGSTVTLYDTDGTSVLGTTTANGSGQWSITSSTLSEGSHTLTAKAVDPAGNVSLASTGFAVTVDHTAPAAPAAPAFALGSDTGVANDGITKLVTPTVSGTAEVGSTVTLYDTDGTTILGTTTANGLGQWSITSSTLSEGSHTLTAKAVDVAGNASLASTGFAVTVDHTAPAAPAAPAFALGSDTGVASDGITKLVTPSFSGTAEAGSTVTLYDTDGTSVLGTGTANGSGQWSITSSTLSEGSHTLTAKAVDVAGNVSAASSAFVVKIDHTAPAAPALLGLAVGSDTGTADLSTANTMPTLVGTAEALAAISLYDTDGHTLLGKTAAGVDGTWSFTSTALTEGIHAIMATAEDSAGNVSSLAAALTIKIDLTAPVAPSVEAVAASSDSGVAGDHITTAVAPTLQGMAEAGASVTLFDTDGVTILGIGQADGDGIWSINTQSLSFGSHGIVARATDGAGNVSSLSTVFNFNIAKLDLPTVEVSTANGPSQVVVTAYEGPVSYLQYTFQATSASEVVIGTSSNDFLNLGGGDDAANGGAGDDVIDGGTGSNFLSGSAGHDVFFVDGRGGATTWSTITDWTAGEEVSIWGWRPGVSKATWVENAGAEGYRGVTMHADLNGDGVIETSVTWSGHTRADLPTPHEYNGLIWFA